MLGRKLLKQGFFFFPFALGFSVSPSKRRVGPASEENNSQPLLSF